MTEVERPNRDKQRASVKRDAPAGQIEAIYNLGLSAFTDSSVLPKFLIAIKDIDEYWSKFTVENDSMLEAMIELATDKDFVVNVEIEVRNTVLSAKALANQLRNSSAASEVTSEVSQNDKPSLVYGSPNAESVTNPTAQLGPVIAQYAPTGSQICLPEIPLPTFDGRLQNWPDFRDRFSTLVDQKAHLTNIEKFYYLLGCLQPGPTDVVKGITVSDATYSLAWSALVNRYDKPRQLATTLVNNMLNATVHHSESPNALINFLNVFGENIAMLKSLNIPDLGSFLIFAISVRYLPSTSRRLFEQHNRLDFPTVDSLLHFIKDRVEVLENSDPSTASTVKPSVEDRANKSKANSSKVVTSSSKPFRSSPVALVANASSLDPVKCEKCSGVHPLFLCPEFKDLYIDERYTLVSRHRLCMICFASNHWANKCKSSCSLCNGRHNSLLHRDNSHAKVLPQDQ